MSSCWAFWMLLLQAAPPRRRRQSPRRGESQRASRAYCCAEVAHDVQVRATLAQSWITLCSRDASGSWPWRISATNLSSIRSWGPCGSAATYRVGVSNVRPWTFRLFMRLHIFAIIGHFPLPALHWVRRYSRPYWAPVDHSRFGAVRAPRRARRYLPWRFADLAGGGSETPGSVKFSLSRLSAVAGRSARGTDVTGAAALMRRGWIQRRWFQPISLGGLTAGTLHRYLDLWPRCSVDSAPPSARSGPTPRLRSFAQQAMALSPSGSRTI